MVASRNKPSTDLAARVGAFVAARHVPGEAIWAGLSGGCDSVVLLHVLARLELPGRLSAIHVHHGLSANADGWADFCADYCRRLGVPLTVRRVAVDAASGQGLEAAARAARYAAFAECAQGSLLLAHHRGDQAETVLFNLLRGSGVAGAAGMPAERRFGQLRLLRPLLDIPRSEIEAAAMAAGLSWIEDESNADTTLTRNYLRHEALVSLSQRFPGAEAALAQAAANFSEAAGLLDQLAELDWLGISQGETLLMSGVRELSPERLKNLLRYRLHRLGWRTPVASRLDEFARQLLLAGPDRHPELVLPDGVMRVSGRVLHWLPKK